MGKSKRSRFAWFLLSLLALPGLSAAGEEDPRAYVVYSEGEDFVLSSGGSRHIYRAEGEDAAEFSLVPGDLIQTGPGSRVEIQLLPGGALVKTAENTSFVFTGPGGGVLTLTLLYGRLRVVTGNSMGAARLRIITGRAETELSAGDMGIDFVIPSGNSFSGGSGGAQPKLSVSALSGSADLRLAPGGGAVPNLPSLPVRDGETVSLEFMDALFMIERKPLDPAVPDYWRRNSFKGAGPLPLSNTDHPLVAEPLPDMTAELPPPPPPPPVVPDDPAFRHRLAIKNIGLISGMILCGAGAALELSALPILGETESARSRMIAGIVPFGLGFSGLLFSLLINPAPQ
jgi:hypothetical protein